jgi:uncharacterized protein YegL
MATATRPADEVASRPLHFFWILDCSGSMAGSKIQLLNFAIREFIPELQNRAKENPEVQILIRAITVSSVAHWHIEVPTPLAYFKWQDVHADGSRAMGQAMALLAEALTIEAMGHRALTPVLVLVSGGAPTDDFDGGLKKLLEQPWARKAVRIGIAIGDDGDLGSLGKFIDNPDLKGWSRTLRLRSSGFLFGWL